MPKATPCSAAWKKSPISRSSASGKRPPNSATARKSRTLPEASTAWAKVDARSDLCTGQKCKQFERCFITLMHQRAAESDIIIVNHHLFFADLALNEVLKTAIRRRHPARISRRGLRRSPRNRRRGRPVFRRLRQQLPLPGICGATSPPWPAPRNSARPNWTASWTGWKSWPRTFSILFGAARAAPAFTGRDAIPGSATRRSMRDLPRALELIGSHLKLMQNPPEEIMPLLRRAGELAHGAALRDGRATTSATSTGWSGAAAASSCRPRPSTWRTLLAERLFDNVDTVVLTSATLAVCRRLRLRAEAAGRRAGPHAGGARPFRLPEAGAALRAAAPARAAQSGLHQGSFRAK